MPSTMEVGKVLARFDRDQSQDLMVGDMDRDRLPARVQSNPYKVFCGKRLP